MQVLKEGIKKCNYCKSILLYDSDDIELEEITNHFLKKPSITRFRYFITCPVCDNEIDI